MTCLQRALCSLALAPAVLMAAECSPRNPERFVDFYPNFAETKGFALQRTELPLPLLQWRDDIDTNGQALKGPQRSYLSSSEYWRWPSMNKFMQDNDLLSHIKDQTKTSAVVELYKDDAAGLVAFHFKIKGGCWYLWQYEVHSS